MTSNYAIRGQSALMAGVDSALAAGALLAPARRCGCWATANHLIWLFRRCGPIWATFAGASRRRGHPR